MGGGWSLRTGEIAPCPFCKGRSDVSQTSCKKYWYVECFKKGCCTLGPDRGSREEAITAWNEWCNYVIEFGSPQNTAGYPEYHRDNLYVLLCACKERYPHCETGDWMRVLIYSLKDQGADENKANCTIAEMKVNLQ